MKQRGFTLVEVLMATVVLALIGGIALVLGGSSEHVWFLTDSSLATMTQAQIALSRVTEDLRNGLRSTLNCPAPDVLSFTQTSNTAITFRCESCDDTTPGTLVKEVNAVPQVVAAGLSAASFTCAPNGLVNLSVTARVNTPRGIATQTLASQVWVKNP